MSPPAAWPRLFAAGACLTSYCVAGCFPSFDGLTGGDGAPPVGPSTPEAALEAGPDGPGPGDGSSDIEVSTCVIDQDAATSKNCGHCGRDCELGRCVDGNCMPYVFVSDQSPVELAIDGANLYWTNSGNDGSVYRIARSGAGLLKPLASAQVNPAGIALTADKIYWVDQGTTDSSGKISGSNGVLMSAALDGTGTPQSVGTSFKWPISLVIDAGRAYVTEHGVNPLFNAPDGDVMSCTLPACADRHADSALFPTQLLLRAGTLYWTTETSDYDNQFGSIWQMPIINGSVAARMFPAIKVQAHRMAFSPDGSTLYFTSKTLQSITRHPLGPGEVTQLHLNFEPGAVLVDDKELFAINANDYTLSSMGSLLRVGRDDLTADGREPGSLKRFAVPKGGDAIVDGGRSVYFTTETSIMKLVK